MAAVRAPLTGLTTVALDASTWDVFADLAERHNGVWGGCWCTWFHTRRSRAEREAESPRERKERLVRAGGTHHALVMHEGEAIGWAQYGTVEELPRIKHRAQVLAEQVRVPDWRITCFFTDRRFRRAGVAETALRGALVLIARAGGGVVETYPQDSDEQRLNSSFLHNGTRRMFEQAGFVVDRPKGVHHCVMSRTVEPA